MDNLSEKIAVLLGAEAVKLTYFASGDLSSLYRVDAGDGRDLIAKGGPDPLAEADMLQRIKAAGAPAPPVIAVSEEVMIIGFVEGHSGFSGADADLGTVLRALHSAHGHSYGFDRDYAFGKVTIPNTPASSWIAFWRENRLLNNLPFVETDIAKRLENLAGRLNEIIPDQPPASLIHGDLWSGNVMSENGRITALIDPASYYGDAEVDLAMLNLFGRLSPAFFENYRPIADGFRARQAVYSLWPALVHLRLFGSGYRGMVEGFLDRTGS